MWLFDEWHDFVRLADLLLALYCLVLLGIRARQGLREWNTKTRDYWFAMVMWTVTSVVLAVEGLFEDRPLEPRLVFYTVATFVTFKGLHNKEPWGGRV